MKKILIISALIIGISSPAFAICFRSMGQSDYEYNACIERERQQRQTEQYQRQQLEMQRQQLQNQQQMLRNQQRQMQRQNNTVTVPQPQYVDPTGFMRPFQRTW